MKNPFYFSLIFILISTKAFAITGLEFAKLGYSDMKEVVTPYIFKYIEEGYRNVPDWAGLSNKIESMIREHGWGAKDLAEIIPLAAKELGMTK